MSTHTPGPWHYRLGILWATDSDGPSEANPRGGIQIACFLGTQATVEDQSLMSAAPDLFEAMQAMLDRFQNWDNESVWRNAAKAMRKAKGLPEI